MIDPKRFDPTLLKDVDLTPSNMEEEVFLEIPPHSFVLGESVEIFKIPRDILCVVVGKSTMCRCGLIVNVSPGEAEWQGRWTIEISNTTPLPARVYCGEGIMQALFFRSDEKRVALEEGIRYLLDHMAYAAVDGDTTLSEIEGYLRGLLKDASCEVSYADKKGIYQGQTGIKLPDTFQ